MKHRLWETGSLPSPRQYHERPVACAEHIEDKPTEKPDLERKREWAHGDGGRGADCSRKDKPIFTEPSKIPNVCRDYACNNEQWNSKGIVIRDKAKGTIVYREG